MRVADTLLRLALSVAVIAGMATLVLPALLWDAFTGSPRYWRILVGLDCAASATFGGDGHTTVSKRAYLAKLQGAPWGCYLCKLLDRIQTDHCKKSSEG